jgi:xanthine dehydrogenase accessory factor
MYDVALSVAACVRAGTRADVAWMISPASSTEAVMITPGGGHLGSLAGGAFTSLLADVATRQLAKGRRVRHRVEEWEAQASGLTAGAEVEFLVVPAEQFPLEVWPALMGREPVAISADIENDDVIRLLVSTLDSASQADREAFAASRPFVDISENSVRTVLVPGTTLVVAGGGPIAEALATQAALMGWDVAVDGRADIVEGLTTRLSEGDAVVVMGHDVETSSRCLQVALESDAGYVGALGSHAMQQSRADWLAYRDVTDLSRVHGPAGIDIGADSPEEIAVSIVAQIIAVRRGFVND